MNIAFATETVLNIMSSRCILHHNEVRRDGSFPAEVLCPAELLPTELFKAGLPGAGLAGLLGGLELELERRKDGLRFIPPEAADDLIFCACATRSCKQKRRLDVAYGNVGLSRMRKYVPAYRYHRIIGLILAH